VNQRSAESDDVAHRLARIVKAYDVRGLVPAELDEPLAARLGAAFGALVVDEADVPGGPAPALVVGHDMRDSSPGLAGAFAAAAAEQGVAVSMLGLASTDLLYYASGTRGCAGAMVTASHNPAGYNGFKLCRAGAIPVSADTGLVRLRERAAAMEQPTVDAAPALPRVELLEEYAAMLHRLVPLSGIRPLRVVVDAGNGMAGFTVPAVLGPTRVQVVPLYFELDGSFPHHPADPLDATTLVDLQRAVQAEGADLGLAFDGDADRCFVVDETGGLVSPSAITALIAVRALAVEPGAVVIHNLITSRAVPEIIAEHGGRAVRTRVGHSFIKARMAETGAVFGGEHSGHYYFRDFWRADSGMLAALHVLAALGETPPSVTLSRLLAPYERYCASGEVNSPVADAAAVLQLARATYGGRDGVQLDELDGLTVSGPDWWFNLRPSNTEPLLRLNVEAPGQPAMAALRDEVLTLVRGPAPSSAGAAPVDNAP
jgi:phosphomannomutase